MLSYCDKDNLKCIIFPIIILTFDQYKIKIYIRFCSRNQKTLRNNLRKYFWGSKNAIRLGNPAFFGYLRSNKGNVNKNSDAMVTNTNTSIGDSMCNLFRVNAIA